MKLLLFLVLCIIASSCTTVVQRPVAGLGYQPEATRTKKPILQLPIYICSLININDYNIFANSGWDGNWHIGYNICWIKELPEAPPGNYRKAFIGAKIGRAKTRSVAGKPVWEKKLIEGDIYIAISSTSAWRPNQRYFLVSADDIPLEGDPENPLEGTGESRWFWREIPIEQINFEGPNYIALWSPTEHFDSRNNAPILCAGWGKRGTKPTTWLNDEIQGTSPIQPDKSLKTPISAFEPAIAMKLVPVNTEQKIEVRITNIRSIEKRTQVKVITASIEGSQVYRAWVETVSASKDGKISKTGKGRKKVSKYLYTPPYTFTLSAVDTPPEGKIYIRVACEDIWSNYGYSPPVEIFVQH